MDEKEYFMTTMVDTEQLSFILDDVLPPIGGCFGAFCLLYRLSNIRNTCVLQTLLPHQSSPRTICTIHQVGTFKYCLYSRWALPLTSARLAVIIGYKSTNNPYSLNH